MELSAYPGIYGPEGVTGMGASGDLSLGNARILKESFMERAPGLQRGDCGRAVEHEKWGPAP